MIDRRNVANLYPLSPLQEGMLYHVLREPGSRAYFEQLDFELPGPLDAQQYLQAWQDLAQRHDMLRTVFAVRDLQQPLQVVLREAPLDAQLHDLRAIAPEAAEARIAAYREDDLARGFDPTRGVPMRLAVFALAGGLHRVVWSFHHILLDGWSLAILQSDLECLYEAGCSGRRVELPPAAPYAAYIRWLGTRDRAAGLAFWRRRLQGLELATPVPRRLEARFGAAAGGEARQEGRHAGNERQGRRVDEERQEGRHAGNERQGRRVDEERQEGRHAGNERQECRHTLSGQAQQALAALAARHAVTLSVAVQALWGVLLGRLNGRRDAAFAATVSGRPPELQGAERTVGLFINAIAVRVRWQRGESLSQLLARLREDATEAQAWHDCPLADVQAAHALGPGLFDHILVFENYPQRETGGTHAAARAVQLHEHTHYAFEFQFLPGPPAVLRMRFDAAQYEATSIAALARDFEALLLAGAEADAPVDGLAWPPGGWPAPAQVALAASFTAEPIAQSLAWWLAQLACCCEVRLAPYNQCVPQLAQSDSVLGGAALGVLLLRFADAARDLAGMAPAQARESLDGQLTLLKELLARRGSRPLLVALLPAQDPDDAALAAHLREVEAGWRSALAALPGVSVLDLRALGEQHGLAEVFDPAADRIGHLPFASAACDAIAGEIARAVHARSRPPFKVVAVDCDNTLWDGVVGEVGPLGVRIGAERRALQRFLLGLQDRGFLLALASKNHEQDVWAVFDGHPDMLLRREHVLAASIGWHAKSEGLRRIAAQLRLGVDSIVFVDDSPLECTEVMRNCPEALALVLPAPPVEPAAWLARAWAFDQVQLTAEDRDRAAMMVAESRRQAVLGDSAAPDLVAQLQLRLRIGTVQVHQLARVAQLTQRTNQFNVSGIRRDEAQVGALLADGAVDVLAVEVEDRFGAYGLTGVAVLRYEADCALLDTLLLSCRVLGRQVEFALLRALCRRAAARACTRVEAPLRVTDRNEPARLFLASPPWRSVGPDLYACDANEVAAAVPGVEVEDDVQFVAPAVASGGVAAPGSAAASVGGAALATAAASRGSAGAEGASASSAAPWPARYPMPIANQAALRHAAQYLPLLAACAGWPRQPLRPAVQVGLPARGRPVATDTERTIAAIWSEVLGREVADAEGDFTAQGGHSLHAVRVVSRLERRFARPIGLQQFLQLGTIAALASWFDERSGAVANTGPDAIPRASDAPDYPLASNQQRLWLLAQLRDAAALHNLCAAFRLRGPLDTEALQRALQRLAQRHEALRTVIRLQGEEPRQRIVDTMPAHFALREVDGDDASLRESIAASARQPVDLETGPLFRAELYRRHAPGFTSGPAPAHEHVLALHLHHLVSDGWSFGLLLDDLAALYAVECGAPSAMLPATALRYRDFAAWSRSPERDAALAADRAWWREQLHPLPSIARIPPDDPAASSAREAGSELCVLPQTAAALQAWCAARGVTLFTLLASLVAMLLWRCGGENAVRLGLPVAGRTRPELEGIVGFFANTVVLATDLQPRQPFSGFLRGLQGSVTGALEHQSYPFERVVADLQPEREAGRHPLFDVLLVLQNARGTGRGLHGLEVSDFEVDPGLAEFDLVFEFGETAGGAVACALRYRRGLYRAETARLLTQRLQSLLHGVLAAPDAPLEEVPLVGARERRLLEACTRGPRWTIPDLTLAQMFTAQAARTPQALAVADDASRLDYATLDQRANAFAWSLCRAHDVHPGDVVAVRLERGVAWAIALLGVLKAGAVYLPLDPQHPPARQRALLQRAGAKVLVADGGPLSAQAVAAQLTQGGCMLAAAPGVTQEQQGPDVPTQPALAPAYLLFTSGSTGEPKGVRVQHRAFVNMVQAQVDGFGITPRDVVLQVASCAFDASLSEFFMAWACGAGVAIASHAATRDGPLLARAIRRHGATVITLTPSHLRQLDDAELAGLRKVVLAAEAVLGRDASRLRALGMEVFNAYGPTETAVCATLARVDVAPAPAAAVPIGRPLANLAVRVVDALGRDLPLGVAGEIVVEGEGVALGYLDESGQGAFFDTGEGARAYRTGDIGRWRPEGLLEYIGRRDAQVKIRGHRVDPEEVAAVLATLPGIRQATVLARQGPLGLQLAACLCGERQPEAVLRARLADRLPPHLLPARFAWVDAMPLTSSGKLDRTALEEACDSAPADDSHEQPASEREAGLLAIWRACLPGPVGLDTDFFDAGGDSLAAMQVARRVGRELGRACSALQLFRTPTVRGLAAALAMPVPAVGRFGSGPVQLVALPPWPGMEAGYAVLARALPQATLHVVPFTALPARELVERYADGVDAMVAGPGVVLLGYSGGGPLALALARALARRGREAAAVLLVDSWRWSGVAPAVVAQVQAELFAQAGAADRALAEAYGRCVLEAEAEAHAGGAIAAPVHHLVASDVPAVVPAGASRDWRALAAGGYFELTVGGQHHQLLDAEHAGTTARAVGAVLERLR